MKLNSFTRACRRAARQVPYHPEGFIASAQNQRPENAKDRPKTLWPRIATIGGAALVTAAAVAITLFTPLFREGIPGLVPGGSSDASEPPHKVPIDVSEQKELLKLEPLWHYLPIIDNAYTAGRDVDVQNMLMLLDLVTGSSGGNNAFQDAVGDTEASKRLSLGESLDQDGYNETGHRLFTKISLSDLNRIAPEYFADLQFEAGDFPDQYTPDAEKAWQWIYDRETDSVYLAIVATGFADPYNRYVVCEKAEDGDLVHYKMVGIYTESESVGELDTPETFADYQNTLVQLALSGDGTPCTLLDVTVKITDRGYTVQQAALTADSGDGEIRKRAMDRMLHSPLLKEILPSVQWTGTGSTAKLLKLQDVLGEFCSTDPGRERLDPDKAKSDPAGFLDSFFWLLVGLQERDQYVFPYDDPDYRDVVERLRLSVPMSSEEYGVTDTRFDMIYRFPLEALNASVARYFQGFRFEPGDFPTQVPEASGKAEESAFVYDQVTGCVYMLTIATGREDPQPLMLICDEQAQNGRLTYTMLGIERSEGDDFSLQEEKDPTLIDSTRFGDFQQRLGDFAEANPNCILYTVRVTVDTAGEHYAIVSLETSGLDPANSGDWQTIQERLAASRDLRAAIAQATTAS